MYSLKECQYWTAEPWKTEFSYRIKKLEQYHQAGFKNVIYLAEKGDQFTFRYRAYNMCHALYGSKLWKGTYFYSDEILLLKEELDQIDLVILVRYEWTLELDYLIRCCRQLHISVVFDVDDYIFDPDKVDLLLESQGLKISEKENLDYWVPFVRRMHKTASLCDFYLTTNQFLANLLIDTFHRECFVLENGYNRWQEEVSEIYYQRKKEQRGKPDQIVLGYFSGSNTHQKDLEVAMKELKELFYLFPKLKLRIVGYMELDDYMKELQENGRIEIFPLQNFIELQRLIAEVDINLIPLVDNIFTNSKSELKYFESGICGTISCASPLHVYRNIIKHGVNGYLCGSGEWLQTLYKLCRNGIDFAVIEKARETSISRYAYYNQCPKIEAVLEKIWEKGR